MGEQRGLRPGLHLPKKILRLGDFLLTKQPDWVIFKVSGQGRPPRPDTTTRWAGAACNSPARATMPSTVRPHEHAKHRSPPLPVPTVGAGPSSRRVLPDRRASMSDNVTATASAPTVAERRRTVWRLWARITRALL